MPQFTQKNKSATKSGEKDSSSGGSSSQELAASPLMIMKKDENIDRRVKLDIVNQDMYDEATKEKPKNKQWASLRKDLMLMKAGKKTASKVGATLAKRMGSAKADDLWNEIEGLKKEGGHDDEIAKLQFQLKRENKIGDKYTKLIGDPERFMIKEEMDKHLDEFKKGGAHAFLSAASHSKVNGFWGGWGRSGEQNFVAPLPAANALVDKAKSADGIRMLEVSLGIKPWQWVEECPDGIIYRYIIPAHRIGEAGLDMARGFEGSAFANEWIAGGKTEGGLSEAVVKSFAGKDYKDAILTKKLIVKPLDLSKQTPRREK